MRLVVQEPPYFGVTQWPLLSNDCGTICGNQGSRKCGSTGAALLGNDRPNWGNDANWEKKKKRKIRKEKTANGKWGKKMKWKIGRRKEKERRQGQNILKDYRVTMKVANTKYGIVNFKKCEENVICWQKFNLLTKMKLCIRKRNFSHWIKIIRKYFSWN